MASTSHTPEMPEWQPPVIAAGESFFDAVRRQFLQEALHGHSLAEVIEMPVTPTPEATTPIEPPHQTAS